MSLPAEEKRFEKSFCSIFSFPSPGLGTHLPGKPRLPVTGDGPKQGLRAQMRSQAGAWEREKKSFYTPDMEMAGFTHPAILRNFPDKIRIFLICNVVLIRYKTKFYIFRSIMTTVICTGIGETLSHEYVLIENVFRKKENS